MLAIYLISSESWSLRQIVTKFYLYIAEALVFLSK